MRNGKRDKIVVIQRKVEASPQQSADGEPDKNWQDYLTRVSAEWITLSGNALFSAQEHHSEVRGSWRVSWRDGITSEMRIVHKGLYYNILFVPPYDKAGKRWQMDLECAEGVNEG